MSNNASFFTLLYKLTAYRRPNNNKLWTVSFRFVKNANTYDEYDDISMIDTIDVVDVSVNAAGQVCPPNVLEHPQLHDYIVNHLQYVAERIPSPRKRINFNQVIIERVSSSEWTMSFVNRGHFRTSTVHSLTVNTNTKHCHIVDYDGQLIFSTKRGGRDDKVVPKKKMPFVFGVHESLLLRAFIDKCKACQSVLSTQLQLQFRFDNKNDTVDIIIFDQYIFAGSPLATNERVFEKEICSWILKHLPSMIVNFAGPTVCIDFEHVIIRAGVNEATIEFQ